MKKRFWQDLTTLEFRRARCRAHDRGAADRGGRAARAASAGLDRHRDRQRHDPPRRSGCCPADLTRCSCRCRRSASRTSNPLAGHADAVGRDRDPRVDRDRRERGARGRAQTRDGQLARRQRRLHRDRRARIARAAQHAGGGVRSGRGSACRRGSTPTRRTRSAFMRAIRKRR